MNRSWIIVLLMFAAMTSGCARSSGRMQPVQAVDLPDASHEPAYVAPQSAPVLAPSYPALGGEVMQRGTASIPLVQGR